MLVATDEIGGYSYTKNGTNLYTQDVGLLGRNILRPNNSLHYIYVGAQYFAP